jgi:diphosphoinositol-polyphosphate diphosphatase
VAVAIPYSTSSDGTTLICLVSSRKHQNQYVLPKGGVEKGETSRQAAIREMWEESGLKPIQGQEEDDDKGATNTILDHKPHKKSPVDDPKTQGFVARAIYKSHEIKVDQDNPKSEHSDWPEKNERSRKWVSFGEACQLIEWRKDIHQLLLQSSLAR